MDIFQGFILGIVEGITEFLPISSTGHLILASHFLNIAQTDVQKTFEIVIQLGAILAVVVLYFRSFFDIEILKRIAIGFIPTGIIGFAFYHIVKTYLMGNIHVVIWSLLIGGIALIVFERFHASTQEGTYNVKTISYSQAFWVGVFQSIAIIPGVSRSAATIVGGLLIGIPRSAIVEFSFLLAVPVMLAASGLDLIKSASLFSAQDVTVLAVGFITSFVVALISIRFLLAYIRRYTFAPFGMYRILIAILFLMLIK